MEGLDTLDKILRGSIPKLSDGLKAKKASRSGTRSEMAVRLAILCHRHIIFDCAECKSIFCAPPKRTVDVECQVPSCTMHAECQCPKCLCPPDADIPQEGPADSDIMRDAFVCTPEKEARLHDESSSSCSKSGRKKSRYDLRPGLRSEKAGRHGR